ncbi:MAG: VWA domain-containing protein [Gemmataceae bacterium]|nr:VWA domain-containing protein [Gemmataceae bacterium]MDW8264252.1 VWA domain-containing protein [Gemmataceae bacterium]
MVIMAMEGMLGETGQSMIDFAEPAWLWAIVAIPPILWCWWRRHRAALCFSDLGLLADLPPGRSRWVPLVGLIGRAIILLLLLLAVAGLRTPDRRTRYTTEGIALMMVLDVSGSMNERDFLWHDEAISRLEAAKKALGLFVHGGVTPDGQHFEGRPNDAVGLVVFATRPECVCPLTLSHSVLGKVLDAEQPRVGAGESETNISDAVVVGLERLQRAGVPRRVLVLLSDGEHNVPRPASGWTPRQAAQIAANLGVPIYTIDAGGPADESSPQRAAGQATLRELAALTGGQAFTAHDTAALLDACRTIDGLERQPIQSFLYRRYYPWNGWLAAVALTIGGILHSLELTTWRRLP